MEVGLFFLHSPRAGGCRSGPPLPRSSQNRQNRCLPQLHRHAGDQPHAPRPRRHCAGHAVARRPAARAPIIAPASPGRDCRREANPPPPCSAEVRAGNPLMGSQGDGGRSQHKLWLGRPPWHGAGPERQPGAAPLPPPHPPLEQDP